MSRSDEPQTTAASSGSTHAADAADAADSMEAEFDTVAAWTAEVVGGLDRADRIPAGCRGSGSPGALHWLLDHLAPEPDQVFLDCGAGVGGPAAFAASESDVRPVLTDPEPGACRAARSLFGLPALRAATQLPLASGAVDVGWSLGVLCTVDDQPAYLSEIRRVLRAGSRFGLIVYCVSHDGQLRLEPPQGNDFPTVESLDEMLQRASLRVLSSGWTEDFAGFPAGWEDVMDSVQAELERRHGDDPRWRTAEEQSSRMGALLSAGEVRGRMLVVEAV
ncbi:class I SAM-dependent methyltransferase [Terrabacter sp. NPDC080008]|uniref:class I SAM-dependent methyltransferase n=1 Tax=Terrabacter sp. NPDC080008 TaxID=3155176 RepID=UPI003450C98A